MNDEKHKRREFRLKLVNTIFGVFGGLGVIASIYLGFSQVRQESAAQTAAIQQQWNSTFYDERIKLYTQATEAAAKIASLKRIQAPDSEIERAILEFRILFWGPMCITEGYDVETAMVKFNQGLDEDVNASALEQLSLRLAHVCKNETHELYLKAEKAASQYGTNAEILQEMDEILASN